VSRCRTLVVLLFCCGVAIKVAPQTTSKPRFNAAVNLVRITVIARDVNGKAVRNLGASDFLVTDDGRRQRIDSLVRVERGRKKGEPRAFDLAKTPIVSRTVNGTVRPETPDTSSLLSTRWVASSGRTARRSSLQGLPLDISPFRTRVPCSFPVRLTRFPNRPLTRPNDSSRRRLMPMSRCTRSMLVGVVTVIPFGDATTTTGEMNRVVHRGVTISDKPDFGAE
jgi:hypothetical protein